MPNEQSEICFYSVSDEFGEFSNFAAYPIQLDGKSWSTSEHFAARGDDQHILSLIDPRGKRRTLRR